MPNLWKTPRLGGVVVATALLGALAACGGGGGSSGEAALTTVEVWDPYPQYDADSDWAKHLQTCAPAGVTLKRTSVATSDLLNKLTIAVKAGNPADVAMLDNPAMPAAATSGLLAPASEAGIDTGGYDENLAAPGTVDGVTYGVPIGVNTLGLFYNKDILAEAGVDPAGITDWATLESALAKVKKAGDQGIAFSGVAGEEGVFQFLPWFWGAGADLKAPGSPQAIEAATLVSGWIGKGYAPRSAISDNQAASWERFLTGEYAFAVNGSWFAQPAAELTKFKAGVMPLPGKSGGPAPVPTGAEFVVAPMQKDNAKAHHANAAKVISCLVGKDNQVKTANALGYFSANKDLRAQQIASDPVWKPWAASIEVAQGRTSVLGAKYTETSAAISTALQTSLNASGDAGKVRSAFEQAGRQAGQGN